MGDDWISVVDALPSHGQHVLVWEDRYNVFPFPGGHGAKGDDGHGRYRMGDAIYWAADTRANSPKWSGQGPCDFRDVTHWMPLPDPPDA